MKGPLREAVTLIRQFARITLQIISEDSGISEEIRLTGATEKCKWDWSRH